MLAIQKSVMNDVNRPVSTLQNKARVEVEQIRRALLARAAVGRGKIALAAVNGEDLVELFPMERPVLTWLQLEGFLERLIRRSCESSWQVFYLRPQSKGHATQERELFALIRDLASFDLDNGTGPLVAHSMSVNTSGQPHE